jgi:hypothetical protein
MREMATTETKTTSPALVAAAWIVVSIPLTWGIYNTALSAVKLFTHLHEPAATAPQKPA